MKSFREKGMNRFYLFGTTDKYAPGGGIDDLIQSHHDPYELLVLAKRKQYSIRDQKDPDYLEWWHIYDAKLNLIIACSLSQGHGWGSLSSPEKASDCRYFNFNLDQDKWTEAATPIFKEGI